MTPTPPLALTFSVSTFHADTLLSVGEDALSIVVGRAVALTLATRDEESFEVATGRHSLPLARATDRASTQLGEALCEFDAACTRLERAGLFRESQGLVVRMQRKIRAMDRAS